MAVIVPMVGDRHLLDEVVNASSYTLHLFKNNVSISETTVIGDFTEADFSGYSSGAIAGWSAAVDNLDHRAISVAGTVTFTHGAGATNNNIYGYYVLTGSGALAWAETFAGGPVPMAANGATLTIEPVLTCRSEF